MSGVENWQHNNDAVTLLNAIKTPITYENICNISPWIFAPALSPHRAAELSSESINFEDLVAWCKGWIKQNHNSYALIEGAGGVAVPINYEYHITDLISELQLPAILVASDYLGAISHSLTALQFLHQAEVEVHAIVINQSDASIDHDATCATIAKFSPYPNAPVLSFKRADLSAINRWNDDETWQTSDILQHNQAFFEFLKLT